MGMYAHVWPGAKIIMHEIACGCKANLKHAWNRIVGQAPKWLCMHPSFGQGPNWVCMQLRLGAKHFEPRMKPHFWPGPKMSMYAHVWPRAKLIMHDIACGCKAQLKHAWNRIVGQAPKWLCVHRFLGRGPIMYAWICLWGQNTLKTCMKPQFWQGPQMIMYAPFFLPAFFKWLPL